MIRAILVAIALVFGWSLLQDDLIHEPVEFDKESVLSNRKYVPIITAEDFDNLPEPPFDEQAHFPME